jgi:hypothetical protein
VFSNAALRWIASSRPNGFPAPIEVWLDAFCEPVFGALPESDRLAARAETIEILCPVLMDETNA